MGVLAEIETARSRLRGEDPREWIERSRDKTPRELSTAADRANRHQFLRESLKDDVRAERTLERILAGNELQDINYLARGVRAAQSVARIAVKDPDGRLAAYGTGFLIAPGVLLTNNHVLSDVSWATRSEAQFGFERDIDGTLMSPVVFRLAPAQLFFTDRALDFTVVAVEKRAENAETELNDYGQLPLVNMLGKIAEGEWLTIIQHPRGEQKQLCVRENRFLRKMPDVIWYSTDTVGGSSGSPVFNNDWFVVALHHSGVPEEKDGRIQTVDGGDFDQHHDPEQRIKWIANEGIRVSRIVETLQARLPAHALLQPVFGATPANARVPELHLAHIATDPVPERLPARRILEKAAMSTNDTSSYPKYVTVALRIDADGAVAVDSSAARVPEAAFLEATKKKKPAFDVPFDASYEDRNGFDVDFLGGDDKRVNLPRLSPALEKAASRLLAPKDGNAHVLRYHNYSLVMHAKRRFAIYTAANVSFGGRYDMSRPPDDWRVDPRIPLEHQVTNFYYRGNRFDRGHLTRREDLEFGDTARVALQSAADTCHWTNCTPQHEGFNQNRELWHGVERHLLEKAILEGRFDAQVITGPILEEDDPVYERFPDIQYPVRFWKVVAVVDEADGLFATAFILDQSDVVDQLGIDEAVPIGAFKTFQVKIAEVERLTGLTFTSGSEAPVPLSNFDPLRQAMPRRRGSRDREFEAVAIRDVPEGYRLISTLESITTR